MSLSHVGIGERIEGLTPRARTLLAAALAAVVLPLVVVVVALSVPSGRSSSPLAAAIVPIPAATTPPTPSPASTPAPSASAPAAVPPTAAPAAAPPAGPPGPPPPPAYPLVGRFDAPSVGVHLNVVSVGLDRHGAMDAPEGPLGSAFWHEAFWFRGGTVPGLPGVATIAGHLDDTSGRPAAFWNIRYVHTGDEVTVTRLSDGAVLRYRIVETDVWTDAQANQPSSLQRIYGPSSDGVSRLTLITCTGRWVNGQYDHRFLAFAELET